MRRKLSHTATGPLNRPTEIRDQYTCRCLAVYPVYLGNLHADGTARMKTLLLIISHLVVGLIGFAAGIYVLPILTAPPAPETAEVQAIAAQAQFSGEFRRDLQGSDALHWGEGRVSIGRDAISLQGSIAPGPDYRLYLSPEFVETEAEFERLKGRMVQVGEVKTFENFVVPMSPAIDPAAYDSVIVWCESFGEFITAAKYR